MSCTNTAGSASQFFNDVVAWCDAKKPGSVGRDKRVVSSSLKQAPREYVVRIRLAGTDTVARIYFSRTVSELNALAARTGAALTEQPGVAHHGTVAQHHVSYRIGSATGRLLIDLDAIEPDAQEQSEFILRLTLREPAL